MRSTLVKRFYVYAPAFLLMEGGYMAVWIQNVVKVGLQMLLMNFHAFPQEFLCNQFSKVSHSKNNVIIVK